MQAVSDLRKKPLGKILQEADLINEGQIEVALREQGIYTDLKFGEILALHGWVKQKTADFFAEEMLKLIEATSNLKIGNYFYQAGLLSQEDILEILSEQKKLGVKFAAMAVMRGNIKQKTSDFFLRYFTPQANHQTDFQYKDKDTLTQKRQSIDEQNFVENPTLIQKDTLPQHQESTQENIEDIKWID